MDVSGMLIRPETPPGASETGPPEKLKQNKPAVSLALPDPSDERVSGDYLVSGDYFGLIRRFFEVAK